MAWEVAHEQSVATGNTTGIVRGHTSNSRDCNFEPRKSSRHFVPSSLLNSNLGLKPNLIQGDSRKKGGGI